MPEAQLEWKEKKNPRLWGHIDLTLVSWMTLGKSLLYWDPKVKVVSSGPPEPSPNYSEGKKNLFIQPIFIEYLLMSGTGTKQDTRQPKVSVPMEFTLLWETINNLANN